MWKRGDIWDYLDWDEAHERDHVSEVQWRIMFLFSLTEVVQGEGWTHEAQLHTDRGDARVWAGQAERSEHQRGKTRKQTQRDTEHWSIHKSTMATELKRVCLQSRYKESWTKLRDGGYKLRLDAIPFQSAKASAEILSDVSCSTCLPIIWKVFFKRYI